MKLRRFKYVELWDNYKLVEMIVTDQYIMDNYYPYWKFEMTRLGREYNISAENCIEDFLTINWATEIVEKT